MRTVRSRVVAAALIAVAAIVPGAAPAAAAPEPAQRELRFHRLTSLDGVPLNVVESGDPRGTPVLLLHGFSQSYLSWLGQMQSPALAGLRLVALDLRGHGGSGKPWQREAYAGSRPWADDVRMVLDSLGLAQPVLVGWSFGGYVAMDYLREHGPARVAGIVLVGSHAGLLPRPDAAPGDPPDDLAAAIENARRFMSVMSAQPLPEPVVERGVASFLMLPTYVRRAFPGKRLDNQDLVGRVDVPLLALLGAEDPTVPAEAFARVLAGERDARAVVLEGVGHSPFAEVPQRFDAELAAFVRRVAPAGPRAGAGAGGSRAGGREARATSLPEPVLRYLDAVNAGDAEGAVAAFAPDGVMYLVGRREARGHAALREVEEFHAIVRPTLKPEGLEPRREGARTIVSMARNVETSGMFAAMGLPTVVTQGADDVFVVERGRLASARQPEFAPECARLMGQAMTAAREWLDAREDPRRVRLLPEGGIRMDAGTAREWMATLHEWRAATGWRPDREQQRRCEQS